MVEQPQKMRVAIIGGGLGGTVLMNGLMHYDHLDVHIYEAKDTFKERGASVGLAINAQRALKCMGLTNIMDKTGAVPVNGARCIIGHGPDQGKAAINKMGDLLTVHRPALLRELINPLPQERLHAKKKVARIEEGQKIVFEDETTTTADIIIGADGIHSSVRQYILGEGDLAIKPVSAGIFDFRTVVPLETAHSKIGDNLRPDQPLQTIYAGDGMLIFFDFINDGEDVCILGAGLTSDDWHDEWKKTVSSSWLLDRYETWPDFVKEMVQLVCGDQEEVPLFLEWESGNSSSLRLCNNASCMIGDAAHATTPWQGAGLGQAIEDAAIIQAVLGECRSIADVKVGFQVYDEVMRPRGRKVIESSRSMAGLLTGQKGLNAEVLNKAMTPMWDFIYDWDIDTVLADVRAKVREHSAV